MNKKCLKLTAVAALCLCAISGNANAAGFQLTEQSVVGLGRAHAGAGIVGDDVSGVFYNPAGMTLLHGTQMTLATTVVSLDIDYKGFDGSSENGRDKPTPVPAFFATRQLNDSLWVGLGISSPYGLKVRYGDGWSGRERGISASVITVDINPNIAWKINDMFSIAGGVSAMYTHSKIKNGIPGSNSIMGRDVPFGGEFEFKGSDWMFTYNLGLMFTPIETVRFGISYRSSAHVVAKGDYYIRGNALANGSGSGKGRLQTPETVMLTGTWEVTDRLRLSALARWANWSKFETMTFTIDDEQNIQPTQGALAMAQQAGASPQQLQMLLGGLQQGLGTMPLVNDWGSVWLYSLGADFKLTESWIIRGGIAYEDSPVKDPKRRTALIPDVKRLWLTCGASWIPNKNWQLDMGYGHIRGFGHRDLWNHAGDKKLGKFEKMNAWMVGASLTYRF